MRQSDWEYKLVVIKTSSLNGEKNRVAIEEELNKWGRLGWELVNMGASAMGYPMAYLKR